MASNNIKFTYKRKVNAYPNLSTKKIRIVNDSRNEKLEENEINIFNLKSKIINKKQNSNNISTYFNRITPKTNNTESVEIQNNTIIRKKKTIESYFQLNYSTKKEENKNQRKLIKIENNTKNNLLNKNKKLQKKNYEQLYINFGQTGISPIICSDCGMPFNPSIREDDIQHKNYHNIIIDGLEYNEYKTDKIVKTISKNTYISEVVMSEATSNHKKKLQQILNLVETELGAVQLQEEFMTKYKFFLYIKNRKLIGCAIVRDVLKGYKIEIEKDIKEFSTIENINKNKISTVPTLCGISRIWVSKRERKKGIASQLLESIRKSFLFNITLERNQIAFSQPTELGTKLAYHFFNYTNDETDIITIPSKPYIIIYMDDDN
ncbi:hypothetical protein BCR36DRAFT_94016 [Piromyces finnis]|uniref:N-acetyltransferase ECO1 n=1 Tax=Piromyces finnis TaxID=1754191 RepID=A0A1Y1V781_9FUNG|nr:hypothetical protein BCR36DRAFT_94016 [Piromyces finnis]|eukprot:ORX47627.1 hypothetical protein BCR36DRAFT_94016 [Piromyces finnis]